MKLAKKRGRKSTYTEATAIGICADIASGMNIRAICRKPGMPTPGTIYDWMEAHPDFAARYARARETQCELLAAEILDIADTTRPGKKVEEREVGRECSTCGRELCWRGGKWAHSHDKSVICEGAKAVKVVETKTITGDTVERSKLQVDARKWYLAKVAPKKYGERLELAGDKDNPIGLTWEQFSAMYEARKDQPAKS